MTDLLYATDSYLKEFDAGVERIDDGSNVILDQTAFYPTGGGQPYDQGSLRWQSGETRVRAVRRAGSDVLHTVEGEAPPQGVTVHGVIDWTRRYQLMRTHTALHALCGIVWREYGAHVTGGNFDLDGARMDFELDHMSAGFAEEIERKVNEALEASIRVEIRTLPREEAFQIPDLIRTKINLLPPAISEIRVVDLVGLDLQADGGTHVANTREVGRVHVVGHESKGKINKRLRIKLE
ncbi:MAG: alanyl-tRNA editing protein [Dehalococcoidia bacterium]